MPLEVYSATKPASPTRAWVSAFGLLLGATALAWSMASGQLDRHLGVAESPKGWEISYRLPKGFRKLDAKHFPSGSVRRYDSGQGMSRLIFSVWRFKKTEKLTAMRACDLVLQAGSNSPLHGQIAGQAAARDEFVGRFPAKEVENPAQAMVVRAAVTSGSVVAFALNGLDPNVVRQGYGGFDLSCRSVKFSGK